MKMNLLIKLNEKDRKSKKRPANLYKFDKRNYTKPVEGGFIFEL